MMNSESKAKEQTPAEGAVPDKIRFDFVKSTQFRVIHADGAWGGLAPQGFVHMALYNERQAIPQQVVNKIDSATGNMGEEIISERIGRNGLVREVEVDVIMSLETARALQTWLKEKIDQADALREVSQKEKK
jgi:hypothetical protein